MVAVVVVGVDDGMTVARKSIRSSESSSDMSVMIVVVVVVEDGCGSDDVGVCDGAVFSGSGMVVSCVSSDWQM